MAHTTRIVQAALLSGGAGMLVLGGLRGRGRLAKSYELASSACVLAAALAAWLRDRGAPEAEVTRPLAVGMACGLAGDLVMGRVVPLPDTIYLPVGMLTFGVGHAAYLRSFGALARRRALAHSLTPTLALGGYLGLALFGWQLWVRNDHKAALSYAALLYAMLLATMAGLATGLALRDGRLAGLAPGGALFIASDLVLGARMLRGLDFPGRDEFIWLSYILAQALIVWTASSADSTIALP